MARGGIEVKYYKISFFFLKVYFQGLEHCAVFQGNRLGFFGYRFLAKRVLHSYFGLEPVFSVSIFQVSESENRN